MASSRAAAAPFALCILLLASPAVSATFLFDDGKSASKGKSKDKAAVDVEWRPATATWYGDAEGDGSTGGACGYGTLVDVVPMKARVGSVSPVLFKGGEGCGACYKVRCLDHGICSRRAVTVIVTDECPGGGPCGGGNTHFDLSGAAFSRMAIAGAGAHLRDRGQLKVIYRRDGVQVRREEHRVPCERGVDELLALAARRVRGRRGRHRVHAAKAGELGEVAGHEARVGRHVVPLRGPHGRPVLREADDAVRPQDAHGPRRHPQKLGAQGHLLLPPQLRGLSLISILPPRMAEGRATFYRPGMERRQAHMALCWSWTYVDCVLLQLKLV
ncbi:unnamed protein product [Triticum turgidum subsp. durum]|uniref:Expansin-like EG45 domain-containing protein n=1 Tax=Triticum turgidum subsp. durum TaxID=4567 RepID=A0A9R1PTW6_TRITD|nr:unnamed protein product [Triticum turgidum subsp. durum]